MKRLLIVSSLILVMMTGGCQLMPPKEIVQAGSGPYPANYQQMIRGYLNSYLYNPASLKDFCIIRPPRQITVNADDPFIPLFDGQKVWECLIVYNATDPSGQYVGRKLHVVWIRFDRIVAYDYKGVGLDYAIQNRSAPPLKDNNGQETP